MEKLQVEFLEKSKQAFLAGILGKIPGEITFGQILRGISAGTSKGILTSIAGRIPRRLS